MRPSQKRYLELPRLRKQIKTQAELERRRKIRTFREGLSNTKRFRPEEIESAVRLYAVMLRGKP